ncbi:MAG: hypothetical protein ACP5H8_02795 [Candidatus Micrarchaeia archaeon]
MLGKQQGSFLKVEGLVMIVGFIMFILNIYANAFLSEEASKFIGLITSLILAMVCVVLLFKLKRMVRFVYVDYLLVASALWTLGELGFMLYDYGYIDEIYAHIPWMLAYIYLFIGLWSIREEFFLYHDKLRLIICAMIVIIYTLFTLYLAYSYKHELDIIGMINHIYPILDIILFGIAAYIVLGIAGFCPFLTLLTLSFIVFATSDLAYSYTVHLGIYDEWAYLLIDPIYNLAYLLFAFAVYLKIKTVGR